MDECVAFEYGVAYGGAGKSNGGYKPRDCQPQRASNHEDCDGAYHNLDLYKKKAASKIFKKTPDLCIHGYNYETYNKVSLEQCLLNCLKTKGCESVDWRHQSYGYNCAVSLHSKKMVGSAFKKCSGWSYYEPTDNCVAESYGEWSNCDKECGDHGTQTRSIQLYDIARGQVCSTSKTKNTRECNRKLCPIVEPVIDRIECTDFEIPDQNELKKYCTDVYVDIFNSANQSTEDEPLDYEYEQGTEVQITRSTTSAFSSEFGWNFSSEDTHWDSTSESTEILIKDPEVSIGFETPKGGASASHSCFNENSKDCVTGGLGIGANPLSSLLGGFGGRRRIFPGIVDVGKSIANTFSSGNDPDKCKCEEKTTTVSKEQGQQQTTTVGRMMTQSQSFEETFERSEMQHKSETLTYTCPRWSDCTFVKYSVTAICAIPYWGTCKAFDADDTLIAEYTVERNDEENIYYTKQTHPTTFAFGPAITKKLLMAIHVELNYCQWLAAIMKKQD
eukprot:TRINITY_DN69_c0_g2_i4.p1 TRINITY_DN69_c0_g2~~TRINITY_DN69_c0_g2_i4.p1  ORF type:complete len:540 (-),score=99.35 TRINITY_DN69_c0_g2_i4:1065-2570(-)